MQAIANSIFANVTSQAFALHELVYELSTHATHTFIFDNNIYTHVYNINILCVCVYNNASVYHTTDVIHSYRNIMCDSEPKLECVKPS